MKRIDAFLNMITMYRLVLYGLLLVSGSAFVFSFFGLISYSPVSLLVLFILTVPICVLTNTIVERSLRIPVNPESTLITGLILFLILYPPTTIEEGLVAVITSVIAIASKYLIAWKKRHLFNPAALALTVIVLAGRGEGIWWVGTPLLFPLVLALGLLVVRKIQREMLFYSFLTVALIVGIADGLIGGASLGEILNALLLAGPLVFFGTIMLTEPLTTPPTHKLQLIYGVLVGLLTSLPLSLGSISVSPEIALVIGNIFSYVVSSKQRFLGSLLRIEEVAKGTYDLVFAVPELPRFIPGQFAECTVPHQGTDGRGSRRYFTIASAPTRNEIRFGIRFDPERASSFKKTLMAMKEGELLSIGAIAGAFTLPRDPRQKVLLIAGGIGVTPFRSMAETLIERNENRDAVLVYANKTESEIAYRELFTRAEEHGFHTEYILNEAPPGWTGGVGYVSSDYLTGKVPDIKERIVYVSGPHVMVVAVEKALRDAGVSKRNIRTDFFPGYA